MTIGDLFQSDPTRDLEEVQKVNARERAESDVREFYETDSAEAVLTALADVVGTHPDEAPRFLYLHATFGSGKTHLLKLIGLVVDDESEFTPLGDRLADKWPGFDTLKRAVRSSHVDRLKPVFLNLLDRDASKEPPLPFLVYEALAREMGYPTDPNWLLEWVWTLDMEYDGIWDALREFEHDGKTFGDVLEGKAYLRSWLYEALPAMAETAGTGFDSVERVKASIEAAESEVDPASFDSEELVERVRVATAALNAGGTETELLLGLDEVALFVGDSRTRYREFEETMEALQRGPNPVVVTTGQYSLPLTRKSLVGEPPENHWTRQQEPLEGADTEIIVRKRWLQKSTTGAERVESLLASSPELALETYSPVTSADPDPIESYPFRPYDLTLLRAVMQELITQGRPTEREYIQGRALLVLVRSLFTKFGWADAEVGQLVTWDELFDLLVEETTYVPLWVQEMIENTLIPTFGGDENAWEVRVAKGLYLLNQTPAVPETPENLGRLMLGDVNGSPAEVVERTETALAELVDKRKALAETNDEGDDVYTLVSEEQESILGRAQTRAEGISPHQLAAWLATRLRENDDFLRSDGSRHEVDVGDERLVPLRYEYSILDSVDRAPTPEYDAIRVRVLAEEPKTVADQVATWQEVNDGYGGGEHVLIAIPLDDVLERIKNVLGMGQVLDEETEPHPELEREHRTQKRRLESRVNGILSDASVYTLSELEGPRPSVLERVVEQQVAAVFGNSRRTLSQPLVEVEDAKAMSEFFRGNGEWPLSATDAEMLGVDTDTAEVTDSGWVRDFIFEHESQRAVDVETILKQTRTANGDYRGTPQESIAALLITLATSNERVALKRDADYINDPTDIGRQVRTKGGLESLQVHFDVAVIDPKKVRRLAETVIGEEPAGDGPDEWLGALGEWVAANSVTVKRTLKGVNKEFGVRLDALESVIRPALAGADLSTSDVGDEAELSAALDEAETFADALSLFGVEDDGTTLWERFDEALGTMTSLYLGATITERMQATGGAVPSVESIESRLADAREHRVDVLSTQHRRIAGGEPSASSPESICAELSGWLASNEAAVREVVDEAVTEFEDLEFGTLVEVFAVAWEGQDLEERDLVRPAVHRQVETYERVSTLLGEEALWSELQSEYERLRESHPDSPTTEALGRVVAGSRPPSEERVRQLLDRARDPEEADAGDDVSVELQRLGDELRQKLPNAEVTDELTSIVDGGERPSEAEVDELREEARVVLTRIDSVEEALDGLEEGSIVVIDRGSEEGLES